MCRAADRKGHAGGAGWADGPDMDVSAVAAYVHAQLHAGVWPVPSLRLPARGAVSKLG